MFRGIRMIVLPSTLFFCGWSGSMPGRAEAFPGPKPQPDPSEQTNFPVYESPAFVPPEAAKEAEAAGVPFSSLYSMNATPVAADKPGDSPHSAPPGPRTVAGPDGFGYKSIDSLEAGGPVFDFIDISATGQMVIVGDDVSSASAAPNGIGAPIALPAPFTLYGVVYNQMNMCSNGYITTDPADTGPDLSNDCPIPAVPSTPSTTGARIYPLQDDLDLEDGFGAGYYEYFESCPRASDTGCDMGCHVFMWDNVAHFPGGAAAATWDMETILYDNGDIVFQIGAGNPETGSSSTSGIQSESFGDTTTPPVFGLTHVCNTADSVPDNTAIRIFLDTNGDGFADGYPDGDGDGTANRCDDCPSDPNKINAGACGCGTSDDDTDGDGVPACFDGCPSDPNKIASGVCGCGNSEADSDGDGVPDCADPCLNDPNKVQAGPCGCGNPDVDTDGDGWLDCFDNCPNNANPSQEDGDGDGVGNACEPAGQGFPCGPPGIFVTGIPMTLLGMGLMRRRRLRWTLASSRSHSGRGP